MIGEVSAEATYPEHEKLRAIKGTTEAAGEFLEWLSGRGYVLARYHEHGEHCYASDDEATVDEESEQEPTCGMSPQRLYAATYRIEELLAEHFGIDTKRLEEEKRAMLDALRNTPRPVVAPRPRRA